MDEYTITDKPSMEAAIKAIKGLDFAKKYLVKIYKWSQVRTTAQNRLLWKWYTEIGKDRGWTKEAVHEYYKEKFLIKIYYRDDPGYARMADAINDAKKHDRVSWIDLRDQVIKLTSTRGATANQMAEFLTSIKMDAYHEGIKITIPPDTEFKWLCDIK
jgi:hypothetical protein